MPDSSADDAALNLVRAARETRVVVIGAGIAGLVAAHECAKLGMNVTVLESADRVGGCLATATLAGKPADLAADELGPGEHVDALLADLELKDKVVEEHVGESWLVSADSAARVPADSVLGIPANPWAEDVRAVIGWRGAWRAYLDRIRPVLTIGTQERLGPLIRSRMGDRVADRLVAPLPAAIWGLDIDDIDVRVAAPGLSAALTSTGSLGGAVQSVLPDSPRRRRSLAGGLGQLVDALVDALDNLAAEIRTQTPAVAVHPTAPRWTIELPDEELEADVLIIAADQNAAAALLAGIDPKASLDDFAAPEDVTAVTFVVEDAVAARDRAYPIGGHRVWAQVASRRWPTAWGDRNAVRVIMPAATEPETSVATALEHARELLDLPVRAEIVDSAAVALPAAPPDSRIGLAAARDALREDLAARQPRLAVIGQWISGSGTTAVVADAVAEAERVRRAALWRPSVTD